MRALILAAGRGSRLRPYTDVVPKPMLSVAGAPILEHNVRALVRHGIRDIIINVHHQPEVIERHFADGSSFGARIAYSREATLLGTGGALDAVRDRLADDFLIVYGDNLTTLDVDRLLQLHRTKRAAVTMAVFERSDVSASGIVGIEGDCRIYRFLEKPRPDQVFSSWVNAGMLVGTGRLLHYIPRGRPSDLSYDILPNMLDARERLFAYRMASNERLWWIDSVEDYERTKADTDVAREIASHEAIANSARDRAERSDGS